MTSFNHMNNFKETTSSSNQIKNNIFPKNNHNLIESIPKLNLQGILNFEQNNIKKSRNNKIAFDKNKFLSLKNNINIDKQNQNSDNEDEKKYETDNNFPINCHNNIFDFYESDKFDTNNSTSLESKNISSFSNNNKKHMINKTVRKKKIINLKSFLKERKIKLNKKYYLDKFITILRKIFIRKVINQLYNNSSNNILSNINKIKLNNLENKIIKSNNRKKEKNNNKTDLIVTTSKNMMDNNDCYNYNNLSDSNSCNNYFYYIEQLSSRYNREKEENIFNIHKYRPTNISFVVNNYFNNNIFNNISNQFELIKKSLNLNNTIRNQTLLYKKYYGDIEAINEEENESEEIRNRKSSRRNEDNSLNDTKSIDDNIDSSIKKILNDMKFKNNQNLLDKNKSRLFNISPPIYDNYKLDINNPINIIDKISEIYNIKTKKEKINNLRPKNNFQNIHVSLNGKRASNISNSSLLKTRQKRKIDENKILLKFNQDLKEKERDNNLLIEEEISKKLIFSIIVFFLFIIKFLFNNSK